jgi:multidrug efflux pump subunit AcrA (membrane-fusion protein)
MDQRPDTVLDCLDRPATGDGDFADPQWNRTGPTTWFGGNLRAPTSGVIANIFHHPGEYITPADPAIVRLMVISKLYAVFNLPVEDTRALRVGEMARIFLRSSSTTVKAAITSIAPNIDGESGTVQVRVELDNTKGNLLSGDRCTLQILYGESRTPAQASASKEAASKR